MHGMPVVPFQASGPTSPCASAYKHASSTVHMCNLHVGCMPARFQVSIALLGCSCCSRLGQAHSLACGDSPPWPPGRRPRPLPPPPPMQASGLQQGCMEHLLSHHLDAAAAAAGLARPTARHVVRPPSQGMAAPVVKDVLGCTSQHTAQAMSSGVARRFSGYSCRSKQQHSRGHV
jgi:hypothetical protein